MTQREKNVGVNTSKCPTCGLGVFDLEVLLKPEEAAAILNVDVSYVRNHSTRLKPFIKHVILGGGRYGMRRYRRSDLAAFIEMNMSLPRKGERVPQHQPTETA